MHGQGEGEALHKIAGVGGAKPLPGKNKRPRLTMMMILIIIQLQFYGHTVILYYLSMCIYAILDIYILFQTGDLY